MKINFAILVLKPCPLMLSMSRQSLGSHQWYSVFFRTYVRFVRTGMRFWKFVRTKFNNCTYENLIDGSLRIFCTSQAHFEPWFNVKNHISLFS